MHADGKSTLASVSKWNSGKVNWRIQLCIVNEDAAALVVNYTQLALNGVGCGLVYAEYIKVSKCMIKVFRGRGRGGDTFKLPSRPCEQLLSLPTP